MADIKTGPYEIMIRFNCERGERFGAVREPTQLSTRSYVVDDAGIITSKIDSGRDDHPHDFPTEDLPDYLGAGFVAFDAHLDNMRAESAALKAELDEAKTVAGASAQELVKAQQQVVNLTAERDAAKAEATTLSQALPVAQQELAAALATIDDHKAAAVTANAKAAEVSNALSARIQQLQNQVNALNDEIDLAHSV